MKITRCPNLQNLSVGLVTFLISLHAFSAAQMDSEFELSLPRQFQQQMINKKWETLVNKEFQGNWQFSDQQMVSQGIPVQIKNISLAVKTYLESPALTSGKSQLELVSKDLQATLHLGEVSVDHVIEREMGGIIGRFRVQALCKDVVLKLTPGQGLFSVAVTAGVENTKVGIQVSDVNLAWSPGSWSAQSLQCSGAQGFETLIREAVTAVSNDSVAFVAPQKEVIKNYVAQALKGIAFDFSGPRVLLTSRPDLRVMMTIQEYKDLGDDGVRVRGHLNIEFLRAATQEKISLSLDSSQAVAQTSQASLRLPNAFIKEFAQRAYTANSWVHQVSSDKISGFQSLMRSRFYQFFVWRALMSFPKTTKFLFDIYSNKDIKIQGEGLTYQIQANLLSRMLAPKNGTYVPFMNFSVPLTSKMQLKFNQGKLAVTFANPNINLSSQWDADYVRKYSPSRSFAASTIRDRISEGLWGKTFDMEIPALPLSEDLSLKVKSFSAPAGQDIVLQLGP